MLTPEIDNVAKFFGLVQYLFVKFEQEKYSFKNSGLYDTETKFKRPRPKKNEWAGIE
jgi:hypothetical protein